MKITLLDKIKDVNNIIIFTASHSSYSDAVLNYLDPEDKYFHYRLYRDSCVQYKTNDINFYVKDLDIFKDFYDLKDIIIIDNYYEYLDLCLETLQDINLKEVPKSKAKINFKFPKEKQNKKIALFDLDETLVHCIGEIKKEEDNNQEFESAHKINVILPSKKETTIAINIRPHLKELSYCSLFIFYIKNGISKYLKTLILINI